MPRAKVTYSVIKQGLAAIGIAILLTSFGFAAQAPIKSDARKSSISLIEKAYQAGEISMGDRLFNNILAVFAPDSLPGEFQSESPGVIRSGTPYIFEAVRNWDLMTPDQQSVVSDFLGRPPLDSVYTSPGGYFKIHYTFAWPSADLRRQCTCILSEPNRVSDTAPGLRRLI